MLNCISYSKIQKNQEMDKHGLIILGLVSWPMNQGRTNKVRGGVWLELERLQLQPSFSNQVYNFRMNQKSMAKNLKQCTTRLFARFVQLNLIETNNSWEAKYFIVYRYCFYVVDIMCNTTLTNKYIWWRHLTKQSSCSEKEPSNKCLYRKHY